MPTVTAARTPDTPAASAGTYAKYPVASEIVISTGGLSRRLRAWRTRYPTARPIAIPPATLTANRNPASQSVKLPVTTAATANR